MSALPAAYYFVEGRPRTVGRDLIGGADEDEPGDLLSVREFQNIGTRSVIDGRSSQPVRRKAQTMGGNDQVHADGAGRKHLFPLGNLHMRSGPADHDDRQRRIEFLLVVFDLFGVGAGREFDLRQPPGKPGSRLAFDQDEPPGHQLAVIRHPARRCQERFDLGRIGSRSAQHEGRDGTAAEQKIGGVGHGVFNPHLSALSGKCRRRRQRSSRLAKAAVFGEAIAMPIRLARLLAAALLLPLLATSAFAQLDASSLAPQGLSIDIPSALDPSPDPRRNQTLSPVSPGSLTKTVLSLSARFFEKSGTVETGIHWRVFSDQPDFNGNHALVLESTDAKPFLTLDPGGYIVHVAYGLATATRHVVLGTQSVSEEVVLNAGALRFSGAIGDKIIPPGDLSFEIHSTDGAKEELIGEVKAGQLLRLKSGSYQVTSTYGRANAKIISEVRVEPGKLTEASVLHKAGKVDLRLVAPNGAEINDANWSLLTPGGDVVAETLTELKNVILAEGDYVALARHNGTIFSQEFKVQSGRAIGVDVAAVKRANPAGVPLQEEP